MTDEPHLIPKVGVEMEDFEATDPEWVKNIINASVKWQCKVCSLKIQADSLVASYKRKRKLLMDHLQKHLQNYKDVTKMEYEPFRFFTPEPYRP